MIGTGLVKHAERFRKTPPSKHSPKGTKKGVPPDSGSTPSRLNYVLS